MMAKYGKAVGLPRWKCHPQALRHSVAIHLLSWGVSLTAVRNWIGHVSIANTDIYLEVVMRMHDTEIGKAFLTGAL